MSKPSTALFSDKAPPPVGPYPHARRVGDLLFLSGIGPRQKGARHIPGVVLDPTGGVSSYDFASQCHSTFKNIALVLQAADVPWDNLIDITVFLTYMQQDFALFNHIYAEYFKHNQPCRTTVGVNSLPTPIAIELKCIAKL